MFYQLLVVLAFSRHPFDSRSIRFFKNFKNLIKVSSDIYFNVASWFPGNIHVKPHFNISLPQLNLCWVKTGFAAKDLRGHSTSYLSKKSQCERDFQFCWRMKCRVWAVMKFSAEVLRIRYRMSTTLQSRNRTTCNLFLFAALTTSQFKSPFQSQLACKGVQRFLAQVSF